MKVLRPLPSHVFGELRNPEDENRAEPDEMLIMPIRFCVDSEHNPYCLCRRAFRGCLTGRPSTIAVVEEEEEEIATREFLSSPLREAWWSEGQEPEALHHWTRQGDVLSAFSRGQVLRFRCIENTLQIYTMEFATESEILQLLEELISTF